MRQKRVLLVLVFAIVISIICFTSVLALNLQISSKENPVTIINDQDIPALFSLMITNSGNVENFEIYSFERFSFSPEEFSLQKGETTEMTFEALPVGSMKDNIGYVSVPLYVRNKANPEDVISAGRVVIKLVSFESAFELRPENINPEANFVKVSLLSLEDLSYDKLDLAFSSVFTKEYSETISLKPYERKEISVPLDKDKMKSLVAGTYTLSLDLLRNGKTVEIQVPIKILEKSGLSVSEQSTGIIIRKTIIDKMNDGNIMSIAQINIRKNIISRLFTTFSSEPSRVERNGLFVDYYWQKELSPNERLSVNATTNWIFPFLLLILIIVIGLLFNVFMKQDLIIKKRIGFVRTKTNDFALKVTISVKARKFAENIKIYDRLPAIAKLYEEFGEKPAERDSSGRLQWNIPLLSPGEERIITYIFYSKINVVGKFELPSATALYEREGKLREAMSNRVFFVNEPRLQSMRQRDDTTL
jgi:hypothetical protein